MRSPSPLAVALLLLVACARPDRPPPAPAPPAEPVRPAPSEEDRAEAQALYLEAAALEQERRLELARPKLERAVRLDPTHADAHVLLAETYWRAGRWDDAVQAAERGRDADPTHIRPWAVLAGYYHGLGLDAESEAAARRWIELGPPDPAAWKSLADLGYDRRNYPLCVEGAEGAIRVVESRDPAETADAAKAIYEEALRSRGVCSEAMRIGAEPAPPADAAQDPAAVARVRRVRKQVLESVRLAEETRFAAASLQLEKALEAQPDDVETLLRLADARWRARRREAAVEAAQRALALEPTNTAALSALALYQAGLQRWAESEASHRRFAELSPADPWPWGGLGFVGFQSGNRRLCVEGYERYLAELGQRDPRFFSEQTKRARAEALDMLAKCRRRQP